MEAIGTKQLRKQLSALVKKAGAGETIVVTIAGEPTAELGPVRQPKVEAENA